MTWQDLSTATKYKLTNIIIEERTPYTARTFVTVFFSLSHLQATYLQENYSEFENNKSNKLKEKNENENASQQNEKLQKVFLLGLSKFANSLNKKQLSNVFYILRVRNVLWSSLSYDTRNILLQRILLFSEEYSSREIISILSGMIACQTVSHSNKQQGVLLKTDAGNDNDSENENEKAVESDKTNMEEIAVKAVMKSVFVVISRICKDLNEIEAKSVIFNLSKVGLFHELDEKTKNILYSKIIENQSNTIPSSSTPFTSSTSISTTLPVDDFDNVLMHSLISEKSNDWNKNRNENENENEKNVKHSDTKLSVDEEMKRLHEMNFNNGAKTEINYFEVEKNIPVSDNIIIEKFHDKFKDTNENENENKDIYVRTGSENARAFEWVKVLARSQATWLDLSIQNQITLIRNLQNIKLCESYNMKENISGTNVLLFLKNLATLGISWSEIPEITQIEILKYAQKCHSNEGRKDVDNHDKKDNDDNDNNNNTDDKSYKMVNSNNKKPLLLSYGLDILTVISNLGCRWNDIMSLSPSTANHIIQNSCNIIVKSRTVVSTKNNLPSHEYSQGVIERNNRLLKYGRTFISTYDELNTNFEDIDIVSEGVLLKSISIVLEGSINDMIIKENSSSNNNEYGNDYDYDYEWIDILKLKKKRNFNNNDDNENDKNKDEKNISNDDNDDGVYQGNRSKDDSINNRFDSDYDDVTPIKDISYSGTLNYNPVQAEIELLEKMKINSYPEMMYNTESLSNSLFLVEKKQADDDFFTEIHNISKFPKKVKKNSLKDKNKNSKNIVLNEYKKVSGELFEKIVINGQLSSSLSSLNPSSSSSSSTPTSTSTIIAEESPTKIQTKVSYSTTNLIDLKNVLSILESSGFQWHRIASRNKIEFSIAISELLVKINEMNYYPPDNIFNDQCTSRTDANQPQIQSTNNHGEINEKQENMSLSYLKKNKKYFYFLYVRLSILIFFNNCGIEKTNVSPQLRNNILQIEEEVRANLYDLSLLSTITQKHDIHMINSLRQFLERFPY